MSGGEDKPEADLKDDFKPQNETFDKKGVLNTDSPIDVQAAEIVWDTHTRTLEELVAYRNSIVDKTVRDLATQWGNHGNNLSTLAAKFSDEVKANIKDSWD